MMWGLQEPEFGPRGYADLFHMHRVERELAEIAERQRKARAA